MKKVYYCPQIKVVSLNAELMFTTDSKGWVGADKIGAREDRFEEDEDGSVKNTFWE